MSDRSVSTLVRSKTENDVISNSYCIASTSKNLARHLRWVSVERRKLGFLEFPNEVIENEKTVDAVS